MPSIYHAAPDRMVGSVLYPLNELEERAPEAWQRERTKYHWRNEVLEKRVPILDCLWNDVLHFGTVHPIQIVAALESAGVTPPRRRFFEVDPAALDAERTVVFLNRRQADGERRDDEQWLRFDPAVLSGLSELTDATHRYYRECAARGARPLLYGYLPHVLFRGSLETRELPLLEL